MLSRDSTPVLAEPRRDTSNAVPSLVERAEPHCSFCRRTRLEVVKLVTNGAGTQGCCNECFVVLASGFAGTR